MTTSTHNQAKQSFKSFKAALRKANSTLQSRYEYIKDFYAEIMEDEYNQDDTIQELTNQLNKIIAELTQSIKEETEMTTSIRIQARQAYKQFQSVYRRANQEYKTRYQYMTEFYNEIMGDKYNENDTIQELTNQLNEITAQA